MRTREFQIYLKLPELGRQGRKEKECGGCGWRDWEAWAVSSQSLERSVVSQQCNWVSEVGHVPIVFLIGLHALHEAKRGTWSQGSGSLSELTSCTKLHLGRFPGASVSFMFPSCFFNVSCGTLTGDVRLPKRKFQFFIPAGVWSFGRRGMADCSLKRNFYKRTY